MKVWVASYELNTSWNEGGSYVLGVTFSRRGAWRFCARDWRELKNLCSYERKRYGQPRHIENDTEVGDRGEDDWYVDYHVDEFEVTP